MLLCTVALHMPTEGTADSWFTPGRIGIALALLQLPFWVGPCAVLQAGHHSSWQGFIIRRS